MGWTVLYIAFGVVALWLLGEVLLQYKARLRWRLLAFGGFVLVVLGVLIPSVLVIALGAVAFAVGQTYVTLSFRRGFDEGWALPGRREADAQKREREHEHDPDHDGPGPDGRGPVPEDDDHRAEAPGPAGDDAYGQADGYHHENAYAGTHPGDTGANSVYEPQPLPDDTGSYGVYRDGTFAGAADTSYAAAGQQQDQAYAAAGQGGDQNYGYDNYSGYDQQQYGYDTGAQQQYAAYSDPYIGTQAYDGQQQYGNGGYAPQQPYEQQQYNQDQYGNYGDTPAGGVWVPQQRNADGSYADGDLPPEQQNYPYQNHDQSQNQHNGQAQNTGYDEQYRY
ncbi:hypothetical protein ACIQU5_14935 [Streptomyces sp. NPDC090306]|uniref:SCO2102 family sporulation regulator n=1 Tax=Streptomyces sp. NPDC090306 TaxID=3365961 RepID=UPI0037F8E770